jgi:hypothetical protein
LKAALAFVLSLLFIFAAPTSTAAGKPSSKMGAASDFVLTVNLPKETYGRSDEIGAEISLTNKSKQTIFVRRLVGWGERSSVSVWIHDLSGKSVSSDFLADELDLPVTSTKQLEELRPGESQRFTLNIPLADYGLKQGKNYVLTVVYHSSIPSKTSLSLPLLTVGHSRISGSREFTIK